MSLTTPVSFIKSFREQSPRSKCINDLVDRIKSEMEKGSTVLLHETLTDYIHPDNMDLALATINLFRVHRRYMENHSVESVRFLVNMLRHRMLQAIAQNPPGNEPTGLEGKPIDPAFFARVQRAFWLHGFRLRRRILSVSLSANRIPIPGGINLALILSDFSRRPDKVDIGRFLSLVESQRFVGTMLDCGIEDDHRMRRLSEILCKSVTVVPLGIQGAVFRLPGSGLPSSGERYSMHLLFQLAAVNDQLMFFWGRYDFSTPSWFDGWFEKYPVSGSIEGFSIGADYSRLKGEKNSQQDKKL
ncbi:hypothetical protein FANTH_10684 [Fusarium anthophilum]|uniref:Uncharacterized protein n=1 Tax=Fusarium anthophilum TaxID=48485 RepID=A0A8H4YZU5_9HYPO|nr:hypothetical protein FANTH_10684 [Fusarium anthophilum]